MALTANQIGFYQDNGYLLLEQAIPNNVLTSLRETVDRFIDASRAVKSSNRIYDLDQSHSADNPRVRRLKDPHLRDPLFKQLAECSTIVDPVCELLGGTVRVRSLKPELQAPRGECPNQLAPGLGILSSHQRRHSRCRCSHRRLYS